MVVNGRFCKIANKKMRMMLQNEWVMCNLKWVLGGFGKVGKLNR
jgi:hypothetical protein